MGTTAGGYSPDPPSTRAVAGQPGLRESFRAQSYRADKAGEGRRYVFRARRFAGPWPIFGTMRVTLDFGRDPEAARFLAEAFRRDWPLRVTISLDDEVGTNGA